MNDQAEGLRRLTGRGGSGRGFFAVPAGARVVAVTSGKGGVGKTSLALNLALVMAKLDVRVVVVDADLGMANIDIMVNAVPRFTLADVLAKDMDVREVMLSGPLGVKIVPGSAGVFELANLDSLRRNFLLERLQVLEQEGDLIIFDTSPGISRNVLAFLDAADEIIVVTTPDPTAITDAYGLIKSVYLMSRKRKINLVVNFTTEWQQGERVYRQVDKVAGCYLRGLEIQYLGSVPLDPLIAAAVRQCTPFVLNHPRSAATLAVTKIGKRLIGAEIADAGRQDGQGFFHRLKVYFNGGGIL